MIEEIERSKGRDVFTQEVRDIFSQKGDATGTPLKLIELFCDTIITTNYDRLIEEAIKMREENTPQIINGINALEKLAVDRVTLIKLQGDINNPAHCILSKKQYDQAYGHNQLDMTLPIPKLLSYYYRNSSLLFLGCSLNEDRTMQVFKAVKDQIGDANRPQHFSIEQAPDDESELVDRNAQLTSLGITAIWFEKSRFEYVDSLLQLAKDELRYNGVVPVAKKKIVENRSFIQSINRFGRKIFKR
ncbi:SIR2 family protein [Chloroflexota bacterium]